MEKRQISRRKLLAGGAAFLAARTAAQARHVNRGNRCNVSESDNEVLGQGRFRYRAYRHWGRLDPRKYPVKDCHGICMDGVGRVVLLTNETHNNLIAYSAAGSLQRAWETRFSGAHGLEIVKRDGRDEYWITDHTRQLVSVCLEDGSERLRVGPEALASKYSDLSKYRPTNTATLPDGDFFIADGYGSSFIHHFDPEGQYIASFGGKGDGPEHLDTPHSVWLDWRSGRRELLICDRGHNALKWFSLDGRLLRTLSLGAFMSDDEIVGALPCNVARLTGQLQEYIAVACLWGMVLIVDAHDRIVSAIGGLEPRYVDGLLQQLVNHNYIFNHPHDVCVDANGCLYVAQWGSNRTYPIMLEPIEES